MKENLKMLLKNSYTPYSKHAAACIVKMQSGQEYIGVNVENASFKSGLCAEQVAIASAFAEGEQKGAFAELHLMSSGKGYAKPCFLCRQLLVEFFEPARKVFCYNSQGKAQELTVGDLCPYAFEKEDGNNA